MIPATFCLTFSAVGLNWGCCFRVFSGFSYFFLLFSGFLAGFLGAVWGIYAVSATFSCSFPAFWLDFGVLFLEFMRFQLLFARSFPAVGLNFGCCFRSFRDYSSPSSSYYSINLKILCDLFLNTSFSASAATPAIRLTSSLYGIQNLTASVKSRSDSNVLSSA